MDIHTTGLRSLQCTAVKVNRIAFSYRVAVSYRVAFSYGIAFHYTNRVAFPYSFPHSMGTLAFRDANMGNCWR
jgi:hypothetical protein